MEEVKDKERFSIKKLALSPFNPLYWIKTSSLGAGLLIIALIGFTVYRAYISPRGTQKIVAGKGSNVTVIQDNQRKRFLIPFVEVFVEQSRVNDLNTGIRGGVKFEF